MDILESLNKIRTRMEDAKLDDKAMDQLKKYRHRNRDQQNDED